MKKLELKNLKVKKLSKEEQSKVTAGKIAPGPTCWNSGLNSCNLTSAWPIGC